MKKSIQTLSALAAFGLTALVAQAQPPIKLLVVAMDKLYDTHYKTEEQNAKLRADEQKAQEEVEKMNKEGNALVEDYKGPLSNRTTRRSRPTPSRSRRMTRRRNWKRFSARKTRLTRLRKTLSGPFSSACRLSAH